jgi:hypothetical protein
MPEIRQNIDRAQQPCQAEPRDVEPEPKLFLEDIGDADF